MNTLNEIRKLLLETRDEINALRDDFDLNRRKMFTMPQAAKYLGISERELAKICRPGKMLIKCSQRGGKGPRYFKREWLNDYIEKHAQQNIAA